MQSKNEANVERLTEKWHEIARGYRERGTGPDGEPVVLNANSVMVMSDSYMVPSPDAPLTVTMVCMWDTLTGGFRVYFGSGSCQFIAERGIKLGYDTARRYFPAIAHPHLYVA